MDANEVVAVYRVDSQELYDFSVPDTHCYFTAGVLHHNTHGVSAELAMHATGQYPPWWEGIRYDKGGWEAWVGSIDSDMQKIGVQRSLLGRDLDELLGTGWLPKDTILDLKRRQASTTDVLDTIKVRHASGDPVTIKFKSYEQGWRKWQAGDPRIVVMDEEPDENVVDQGPLFAEIQTRLVRNQGILMVAYTPLLGETELTQHFMNPKAAGIFWVGAGWDDAPHLREEDKERLRLTYPAHQLEARTMGVPMLGEGRIFSEQEKSFVVNPFEIPKHWSRIVGVDFGLDHPAACAWFAIDRDADIAYLYDVWRKPGVTTADHAAAIRSRGEWIPCAWPHDGEQRDRDSKEKIATKFRKKHGVRMLTYSARYEQEKGGGQAQWPIIEEFQERLGEGRMKVFSTCKAWLEEYRSYHLKDGKIVSRRDDALKASFYGFMMRRYAVSENRANRSRGSLARMPMAQRA